MGCNASSHADLVGGVGGLYHIPNEEGDTSWSPRSVADALRQEQRHRGRSNDAGQGSEGCSGEASCEQEMPCGTLAPISCPTDNGNSPERHPLPPNRNGHDDRNDRNDRIGDDPVEEALNECCRPSQPGGMAAALQPLNDSLASWNNSIVDDAPPAHPPRTTAAAVAAVAASPGSVASGHNPAFAHRRWLVLPEQQYDMAALHPPLPPFLGSMYWTAASPLQPRGRRKVAGLSIGKRLRMQAGENGGDGRRHVPSLITDSPVVLAPSAESCTKFGLEDEPQEHAHDVHSNCQSQSSPATPSTPCPQHENGLTKKRAEKLLLSLNSTEEWESEATSASSSNKDERDDLGGGEGCDNDHLDEVMNQYSPRTKLDISRELLDYSALDESFVVPKRGHQSPRRLFDDDGDDDVNEITEENEILMDTSFEVIANTPSRRHVSISQVPTARANERTRSFQSMLCMAPLSSTTIDENDDDAPDTPLEARRRSSGTPPPAATPSPSSPNVATFYGHWGSRRERHVSTLPSPNAGEPIRLRVTESGLSGGHGRYIPPSGSGASRIGHSLSGQTHNSSPCGDFFSYDPYFSTGKYTVTLPNGRPYGNGLAMRMGWQFMILEDSRGAVLAVVKSRHTHAPSAVVYAPKARHEGQVASGHRLTRQVRGRSGKRTAAVVVDGNSDAARAEAGTSEALYPWALVCKAGRTMEDDCTVHLANDDPGGATGKVGGGFRTEASFRGRHGFDRELRTHTVVSRTTSSGGPASLEGAGVPCCVIVRDPSDLDAVDITIAPGIDPLLMICYLASHSKMDVEPLMNGY